MFVTFFIKVFGDTPTAKLYVGEMSKYYVKLFKKKLKKNAKILDLGCGPGYFSLELARAGFNVEVLIFLRAQDINQKKTMLNLK